VTTKRKPGRPKGTGTGVKYCKSIFVRVTAEQLEEIKRRASAAGQPVSAWIRAQAGVEQTEDGRHDCPCGTPIPLRDCTAAEVSRCRRCENR